MTDRLVERVPTQCTPAQMYEALNSDWLAVVTDAPPSRGALLTLVSQWAFETGWGHACWCWNIANHKHVAGDGYPYYMIRDNEVIDGKIVWYDPPDPATWFRSYGSIEDGVREYLTGLRGRFGIAWPAVLAGDPAEFAHQLKKARYYTDDESHYTHSLVQCFHMLDQAIHAIPSELATSPDLMKLLHPELVTLGDEVLPEEDLPPEVA
jgi:hypothetical protein